MKNLQLSRRSLLGATAGASALTLAGCGTSGPGSSGGGGGGGDTATYWDLSGEPGEGITQEAVDAFNELDQGSVDLTFFQNDAYKQKIRTAIGAGEAPTIVYGWGGGGLRTYVASDQVEDLTGFFEERPEVKDRFVEAVWGAATVEDKIYAVPNESTQPIILFNNRTVLDDIGAEPPTTWDDLMSTIEKANSAGVAPISLAGQSRWTSMMWLEYLLDRIGGAEAFERIAAGEEDAWLDDSVVEMGKKVEELIAASAFVDGFESMAADSNSDQALLWTDQAALMLHGGWTYGSMKTSGAGFVQDGRLGYDPFPTIDGGKGDLANLVGNPAGYLSISADASDEAKEVAKAYFTDGVMTDAVAESIIDTGGIPVVTGQDEAMAASEDSDYLEWVYGAIQESPAFTQSWDQALQPTVAETLLVNTEQLFLGAITPEQFAETMNSETAS